MTRVRNVVAFLLAVGLIAPLGGCHDRRATPATSDARTPEQRTRETQLEALREQDDASVQRSPRPMSERTKTGRDSGQRVIDSSAIPR